MSEHANSSRREALAWAAGFFDGEGSIFPHVWKSRRSVGMKVSISQVDRQPLDRFMEIVGVGFINGPYCVAPTKKGRDCYLYRASGKEAEHVLEQISPFLSDPKSRQIDGVRDRIVQIRDDFRLERESNVPA